MQESFWSTLKTEFYDRRRWATRHAAIRATGRWIEEFYNRARLRQPCATAHPWNTNDSWPQQNLSRHKPPDQLSTICGNPTTAQSQGSTAATTSPISSRTIRLVRTMRLCPVTSFPSPSKNRLHEPGR
jgi:hypothetical protein